MTGMTDMTGMTAIAIHMPSTHGIVRVPTVIVAAGRVIGIAKSSTWIKMSGIEAIIGM